jgi:hypothetical protein
LLKLTLNHDFSFPQVAGIIDMSPACFSYVATKAKEESDFLKLTDFSIAQAWDS